jgi:TM2 domain-containing membrane protein YozV
MYSKGLAYLLWAVGGFGALGLHRFYLGKIPSGILWACTGGLLGIGSIVDLLTLGRQVDEANALRLMGNTYGHGFIAGVNAAGGNYNAASMRIVNDAVSRVVKTPADLEHAILSIARANHGIITPNDVTLEVHIKIDDAKKKLEDMAKAGHIEMRVRKNGSIVYTVADFLDSSSEAELEGF